MERVTYVDHKSGQVKRIMDTRPVRYITSLFKKVGLFVKWFVHETYLIANTICTFAEDIMMGNFAPKAIRFVSTSEYYRFQAFYDHLDNLKLNKKYKYVLCTTFSRMPIWLKKIYCQYANRLVCFTTHFYSAKHKKATGSFNYVKGGYNINQWHDLRSSICPGSVFFHETAHMIAWLMIKDGLLSYTFEKELTQSIHDDFNAVILNIMKQEHCSEQTAKQALTERLKQNGRKAFCVSDVFGGLTFNTVCGRFIHDADEYWATMDDETVGCEAFAEITSMLACKDAEAVHFTGKYLPQTMFQYEHVMKEILA